MAGDDWQARELEVALHHVQVGAATTARRHADAHLVASGLGQLAVDEHQRLRADRGSVAQLHRAHVVNLCPGVRARVVGRAWMRDDEIVDYGRAVVERLGLTQ
jgi:hypothetical protein